MKLTTHLYLMTRPRMSGAMPLRSLYVFMAWVGKIYIFLNSFPFTPATYSTKNFSHNIDGQ